MSAEDDAFAVTIRTATLGDLPAVLALYADDDLALHPPGDDLARYEEAFLAIAEDPRTAVYVASRKAKTEIIGTFQATLVVQLTARVLLLESVHVHSSVRGLGVGTQMMRWAIERGRAERCSRVQLTTQKRRKDAHRFYERLGFVASHVGMRLDLG